MGGEPEVKGGTEERVVENNFGRPVELGSEHSRINLQNMWKDTVPPPGLLELQTLQEVHDSENQDALKAKMLMVYHKEMIK